MHRPSSAEAEVADELAAVRPDLASRYAAELPGARAAVLTRLWRALVHEPLPWIVRREGGTGLLLADGRRLEGPYADPYAVDGRVTAVRLGRVSYDDPARLLTDLALPHGAAFAVELGHSVASLALSRANQDSSLPALWRAGSGSSGSSTGIPSTPTAVPGPGSRWPSSSRTDPSTVRSWSWRRSLRTTVPCGASGPSGCGTGSVR